MIREKNFSQRVGKGERGDREDRLAVQHLERRRKRVHIGNPCLEVIDANGAVPSALPEAKFASQDITPAL
jgi:hypothetical protein